MPDRLVPRHFRREPGRHLDETSHRSAAQHEALAGRIDARHYPQQARLACTIVAEQPEMVALADLARDILQRIDMELASALADGRPDRPEEPRPAQQPLLPIGTA